ncbi:MAG TPA: PASTA domain-containing protein [Firmicutes bacterium]|nr:PASTA domain-containing protein [Bacillota bacterium]
MATHRDRKETKRERSIRIATKVLKQRTLLLAAALGIVAFVALACRLYYLQIIRHDELQEKAVAQQTRSSTVAASRGTIYDANGEPLAISATAETIFISPHEITEYECDKDLIAETLSEILGVDEEDIRRKEDKVESYYQVIRQKVEQEQADEVREFINENEIRGIYLVPDSKRYYPFGSLACQIIGFVGGDNQGLYGIEAQFDDELEGTAGLVVTEKNAWGEDVLYKYEQYYDAEDGDSLVLTIDSNIQHYLEQGLSDAIEKYDVKNGATGIVMNVKTGAILAMASLPNYDLNDPWTIYDENLAGELEGLEGDAYTEKLGELQLKQWRNKAINDTYEPGSTFKIITLAMALEEGIISESDTFECSGSIMVPGWPRPMYCSRHAGHGHQTLAQAVANSCNPAFIQIGLKVGTDTFYDYVRDFGFLDTTGIDLQGEGKGIFFSEEAFGQNVVSLASAAFGQTFNVTPIALITAEAAAVNGGYLHQPYVVQEVLDSDGNVVYEHDSTPVRQVISEDTSKRVCALLEGVVDGGTGKNAYVAGYRIGGKTGTADKTGSKTEDNPQGDIVVSFVGVAPIDDPEIILLIALDTPSRTTGTYPSGGNMAAPTAGSLFAQILPYLGIEPNYSSEEMAAADANVPNCVGLTAEAAKERLSENGFACRTVGDGAEVTDQTPVGGSIVPGSAEIILYLGEEKPDEPCTVPNVVGMSAEQANTALTNAGLIIKITGDTTSTSGTVRVTSQSVQADTQVEAGTVVTVQLSDTAMVD